MSHLNCNNYSPHGETTIVNCMCVLQTVCLFVLLDSFSYYHHGTVVATIKICILLLRRVVRNFIFYCWRNLRTIHDNIKIF